MTYSLTHSQGVTGCHSLTQGVTGCQCQGDDITHWFLENGLLLNPSKT